MISVTPAAVEHLRGLVPADAPPGAGLRIFVEKGGCSGLSYGMGIASPEAGDTTIEAAPDVRLHVDAESTPHLSGCVIDYHDGLTGSGFRIQNPNAARTCGCGTSFEPVGK